MDDVIRGNVMVKDKDPDLSQLLRDITRKDTDALETLYRSCRKGILAVSYAITRDEQTSEDILQETTLYVWRHADQYRYDHNPRAWIYSIVRHLSIDTMRRNRNWTSIEEFEDQPLPEGLLTRPDPDSEISLRWGIAHLGTLEAQVFVLKAIAGFNHYETAKVLQISYRSVHYRYRRALSQLRKMLAE